MFKKKSEPIRVVRQEKQTLNGENGFEEIRDDDKDSYRYNPSMEVRRPEPRREEPVEEKNIGLVISSKLMEGMKIETVIVSNRPIGEVGESFEI